MKTLAKLIYVEADEEITELVDRLRTLQTEEAVTLVIPESPKALQSPMSFRLLKRYAQNFGIQLNVVSGDSRIRALSLESGFSTFASVEAYDRGVEVHRAGSLEAPETADVLAASYQPAIPATPRAIVSAPAKRPVPTPPAFSDERPPAGRPAGPTAPRLRRPFVVGAGLVVLLAILAGGFYLPTATVTLSVAGTKVEVNPKLVGAAAAPAGATDRFQTKALDATASQQAQVTATGQKTAGGVWATGEVVFTCNCSQFPQGLDVQQTAIVSTSDMKKRYALRVQKPVHVPPDGTATAPIIATQAGTRGNTGPGTIKTIEGLQPQYQAVMTVDNLSPIVGGIDPGTVTIVQDSDITIAKQALVDQLAPKVQNDLNGKVAGLHLVPESIKIDSTVASDAKVGDQVTNFNITVTVTGRASAFDDAAVRKLLAGTLEGKVPTGQQLSEDPIATSYKVAAAAPDGNVTLDGHAQAFTRPVFNATGIRSQIKGKSPGTARASLQHLPGVVDVLVRQQPMALPWLPLFSSRIFIRVQEASVNLTR